PVLAELSSGVSLMGRRPKSAEVNTHGGLTFQISGLANVLPPATSMEEIVQLRRMGFRFIALADDNFYPVTITDLRLAEKQNNQHRINELKTLRAERFTLMKRLAQLPPDTIFFTQITMEAAEDPEFLEAMNNARIKGALVGVE